MQAETSSHSIKIDHEFGSERDVSRITGRSTKTLQKDRLFGRGFPFFRFGRMVLYDLNEVREIVRSGRVEVKGEH